MHTTSILFFTESTILFYYSVILKKSKNILNVASYIFKRGDVHTENMHSVLHMDVLTPFPPTTTCCACTILKFNSNMPKDFIPW